MLSRIRWPYTLAAIGVALLIAVAWMASTSTNVVLGQESQAPFVDDGRGLLDQATISLDDAIATAQSVASGPLDHEVDLDREGDRLVYEIEIGNTEVKVDANDGSIVNTDANDDVDDDDTNDDVDDDDINDGVDDDDFDNTQSLDPAISADEAIQAAQTAAPGTVRDVELEYEDGRLVYTIDIGQNEVEVDATDGSVLSVEADD